MTTGDDARRYLRAHNLGVLSSHSKSVPGYPFGSVVPVVCDARACPVVLVSGLAEHTRSLAADARASLIVHDFSIADQAGPRLTVLGDAVRCEDADAAARYLRYFPESERLLALGDFAFWRLVPREALFIRGFGRIEWVQADALAPPPNDIAAIEPGAVEHMNADHGAALAAYCASEGLPDASGATMVGLDCDGFDVRIGARIVRFPFDAPVTTAGAARQALAGLARRARGG